MNNILRHWRLFGIALKEDRARQRGKLTSSETDFLPAALEVIERPPSPTARLTLWVLMIGLAATIAWLILGKVDVVASAPGKLIPTGNVKLVQAANGGVVRHIYVHDGDLVRAGQALIDLDPTLTGADLAQAEKALASLDLDIARGRALAAALSGNGLHFVPPPSTPSDIAITQRNLIAAQIAEIDAGTSSLAAARASALSDANAAQAQIAKLSRTVPILDSEIEALNELDRQGYAPGLRLDELRRQRQQEAGDSAIAAAQRSRGMSDAQKLSGQSIQSRQQALHVALAELAKAEAEAVPRREEVTKAREKSEFQRLVAPADGTIQQLSVHTIGGIIEAAKPLMIIVPIRGGLEVEAKVLNKDAGFVKIGQTVQVKFEAFPFTRYGSIRGIISGLSRDTVSDQKLGAIYVVRISLDQSNISIDGKQVPLNAGLVATADIRTGSRRIISYLLSPLQTSAAQAGRER